MCWSYITLSLIVALSGCSPAANQGNKSALETFDYLDSSLADGFDFPVGDRDGAGSYSDSRGKKHQGWYIATFTGETYSLGIHTGEDWNGKGGGNTDMGQPVYAIGKGTVLEASNFGKPWGNIVLVKHCFLENGKPRTIFSLYAHLDKILVEAGTFVQKRQQIGTIGNGDGAYPAHLHLEIRSELLSDYPADYWPSSNNKDVKWVLDHYLKPSEFIKTHRKCLVPSSEKQILIAVKSKYQMCLYEEGSLKETYEIALSQEPVGHKEKQGDNRLPEGEYRIIQKSKGPFSGDYAAYFGPAWFRINYPNNYDAEEGYRKKLISANELERIKLANASGSEPPKNTALGGGIGIHGWAGNWPLEQRDLTWGCISMRNQDLPSFYSLIRLQTPILILP